jgi:hypothetical protein
MFKKGQSEAPIAEKLKQPLPQQAGGAQIAAAAKTAVGAVIDYAADAGAGLEGADKDSYAIPFLLALQPLSPQVVDKTVAGAEAGMLMNSVTLDIYKDVFFIPCAFQRRFIQWGAREAGGGFKGEFSVAQAAELRTGGKVKELEGRLYFPEPDGSINPKKSDRLADTRSHFGLMLATPSADIATPVVFALSSSGIKISKGFMSRIESIKDRHPTTQLPFTPPAFSHVYRVTTTKETNDKGTWFQPKVELVGKVTLPSIYAQAKAFYSQVVAGKVDVAHNTAGAAGAGAEDDGTKGF